MSEKEDVENGSATVDKNTKVLAKTSNTMFSPVLIYSFGFFVAMLAHDGSQEFLVNTYGKTVASGKWLGLLDCLGCLIGAYAYEPKFLRDIFSKTQTGRRDFLLLTLLVYGSVGAANVAITKVSYPIKVIGKSCKLIPTMIISSFMFSRKKFTTVDYAFACSMCFGLAGFVYINGSTAKTSGGGKQSTFLGMALLGLAITFDAIAPNIQERVMKNGHSPLYTMGNTNFYSSAIGFVVFITSEGAFTLLSNLSERPVLLISTCLCSLSTFVGVACYLKLVNLIGGVNTTIISTIRKIATIIFSFIFFPKPFGIYHLIFASLVFIPLFGGAYLKGRRAAVATVTHSDSRR